MKKNNKGFSLVELIIVIAIMAILAGLLAPALIKYIKKARESKYINAASSMASAIDATAVDMAEMDSYELAWLYVNGGQLKNCCVYGSYGSSNGTYGVTDITTSQSGAGTSVTNKYYQEVLNTANLGGLTVDEMCVFYHDGILGENVAQGSSNTGIAGQSISTNPTSYFVFGSDGKARAVKVSYDSTLGWYVAERY